MCDSRCTGAKSPPSKCRCKCGGANHGSGRQQRRRVSSTETGYTPREAPTSRIGSAARKIGFSIIRGAAVGVACGVAPAACPAILAINQVAGLAQVASDVYQAYRREGLGGAADKTGQAAVSTSINKAIQDGAEEEIRGISKGVGAAMSAGASGILGADPGIVQTVAEQTTYHAMEEGIEGVVSWGVEEIGGSS